MTLSPTPTHLAAWTGHGKVGADDGLDCTYAVSLDAWSLDQTADGVALTQEASERASWKKRQHTHSKAQVVLNANFGRLLDCLG